MFTRNRFQAILIFFHIVNNESIPPKDDPNYKPNMKIKPIVDHINSLSMYYYTPNQNISIDESLVGSKGRNPIRQYMPNKHHCCFGTKLWILACSVTSYILKMYVYQGAHYDKSSGRGVGYDVVVRLMEMANIYNAGYHLFTDNLFTTYDLANYLRQHQTFLTRTMHRNQLKHILEEITQGKPKVVEEIYSRQNTFLAMSYEL